MIIQLNGNKKEISTDVTITDLLQELDLANTSVVIVLNQTIIQQKETNDISLKEGDTLELIRFVGGG